jgi:acetyl esterase/lipase
LDPECGAALAALRETFPVSITPDTIPMLRETSKRQDVTDEDLRRGGSYTFFEPQVPGPPGAPDITLLVWLPISRRAPVPVIYAVHGGGMIGGSRRNAMHLALDLAAAQGMALVSVEYRVAPEHPDPAPVEDCYAGLMWTAEHADEFDIDPDRIVVAGGSAGGGLAAGVALLARDRGGPALHGQLLMCPMLDDRNDTVSALQMEGVAVWDRIANQTGWQALLGERQGGPDVSPYAAPARATDLSGLPPALIDVGSAETFRDEAVTYASRIWQAGGSAELHVWPGGFHGYEVFAPEAAVSQATNRARHDWLQRLLAR